MQLLAKRGSPGAAGLVNAVLRSMERSKNALPDLPEAGTPRELSIRFSHPLWLCERLVSEYGYDNARAFLEADNTPPDLTVTANLCRTDAVSLLNRFRDAGLDAALSPLSEISIRISAAGSAAAHASRIQTMTPLFRDTRRESFLCRMPPPPRA